MQEAHVLSFSVGLRKILNKKPKKSDSDQVKENKKNKIYSGKYTAEGGN